MAAFTVALALAFSTPTVQQSADPAFDARCVVALQAMSEQTDDQEAKAAVTGIMFFYLGRMSSRWAPTQMEGAINDAATKISEDQYREVGLQCIEQMRQLSGAASVSS